MELKIKQLIEPKEWIRKHLNKDAVASMTAILKDSEGRWSFPPIEVRTISNPEKGKTHEIIDGLHRVNAAIEAGLKTIPVREVTLTDTAAAVAQLEANIQHGTPLTPVERNRWAIHLVSIKVDTKKIAEVMHLSVRSIERIVKGEQSTKEGKRGPNKKKKKETAERKDLTPAEELLDMADGIINLITEMNPTEADFKTFKATLGKDAKETLRICVSSIHLAIA